MRDQRLTKVGKGLRRRGRLLAAAVRPPGQGPEAGLGTVLTSAPRLVERPVFVLSPVRSGSTLLRVLLNSHSLIRAPHEMHLRTLEVRYARPFTAEAMSQLDLEREELEHLLWDRVLHLELQRSGKQVIVDKTPANAIIWRRVRRAWPRAQYVFLLRHPASVMTSLMNRRTDPDPDEVIDEVLLYTDSVEEARQSLPGLTVRYEDLTTEPERVTADICAHLSLDWEPGMLRYGEREHGPFRPFIGDWSSNIKSGRIQRARETPTGEDVPKRLREPARLWGYPV